MSIKKESERQAAEILTEIQDFVTRHNVNKSEVARACGTKQQNINERLGLTGRTPRLDTLLLIIAALEKVTGIQFERPRFLKEIPVSMYEKYKKGEIVFFPKPEGEGGILKFKNRESAKDAAKRADNAKEVPLPLSKKNEK